MSEFAFAFVMTLCAGLVLLGALEMLAAALVAVWRRWRK